MSIGIIERFALIGQIVRTSEIRRLGLKYSRDLDHRVGLAMTVTPANIFAPAKLLDDDLLRPELIDDLGDHAGTVHCGSSDRGAAILLGDQQDLGKDQLVAGLAVTAVDPDSVPFTNPELMTAVLKNRVHPSKSP